MPVIGGRCRSRFLGLLGLVFHVPQSYPLSRETAMEHIFQGVTCCLYAVFLSYTFCDLRCPL